MNQRFREYYRVNPDMVSSPFGGVDGIHREMMLKVFELLGIELNHRRVLDVGCGRGYAGDVVTECGGDYFGADLVASRTGVRMVVADGSELPFADATFDAVLCIDVFEHFPDPGAAAREFHRLVRPGGFVFVSAPNYGNVAGLVKKACETFGGYEKDTWAPFGGWKAQELEQFVTGRRLRRVFRAGGIPPGAGAGASVRGGRGSFSLDCASGHARLDQVPPAARVCCDRTVGGTCLARRQPPPVLENRSGRLNFGDTIEWHLLKPNWSYSLRLRFLTPQVVLSRIAKDSSRISCRISSSFR